MDIFAAFGLSASAGLNAYIPLLIVSLVARFTNLIELSDSWRALESWWVIGLLIVLALIEFFADKIPEVNHINDIVQTLIRPIAGAILFAARADVITNIHPILSIAAGLLVAGGVHTVKTAVVRPAVTLTTGGLANPLISLLEDLASTALSVLAIVIPVVIGIIMLLVAAILLVWLSRHMLKTENQT